MKCYDVSMRRYTIRCGALALLVATLAMLFETSCSQAPAPNTTGEHAGVVTKIYTLDGTLYVASRYVVTDTHVVIRALIRDDRYYPKANDPLLKKPPADVSLPLRIPADQVQSIEPWASHTTRNALLVATGVALVAAIFVFTHEFSGYNDN
jgi:hypothetical protein